MATKLTSADLRVGNHLNWGDTLGTITQITYNGWIGLKYDTDKYRVLHVDMVKPIQLTEEWLVKFGFEKQHDDFIYDKGKLRIEYIIWADADDEWKIKRFDGVTFSRHSIVETKYVHQLQNLYYALTKTELTIKEDKQL